VTAGALKNPKKTKTSFVFKQKTKGKIYKTDFFNSPTVHSLFRRRTGQQYGDGGFVNNESREI